jgi:hypothetical protein
MEATMQARVTAKPQAEVAAAIAALDLESVKLRLMDPELGKAWSRAYADNIEHAYKTYLWMLAKYQDDAEQIMLSKDVDEFWHTHILQTAKYTDDCQAVFGQYLHHNPHIGERTAADDEKRAAMAARTRTLYEREFGRAAHTAWTGTATAPRTAAYSSAAIRPDAAAYSSASIRPRHAAYSSAAIHATEAAYSSASIHPRDAAYSSAAIRPDAAAYSSASIRPQHAAYSSAAIHATEAAYSSASIRARDAAYSSAAIRSDAAAYSSAAVSNDLTAGRSEEARRASI